MIRSWRSAAEVGLVFALLGHAVAAAAAGELKYQKRGQRYEGILEKPVSGYDLELLSARVDSGEEAQPIGERLTLKFFLEQPAEAHVIVREIDDKHNYRLDKVTPAKPWQAGFGNVFEWPGGDVVKQLGGLKLADLGVVVRLEKEQPNIVESVAPAMLYQSRVPARIKGYLFSFHVRDDASITSTIFKEGVDAPLERKRFARHSGGSVLNVKWDTSNAAITGGRYTLVLSGYWLDTNAPVNQTVRFYHQPVVR